MLIALGIGNPNRRDDRAGLVAARLLRRRCRSVVVIIGGVTPEGSTAVLRAARPDAILLIDAVHFGEEPGYAAFLTEADLTGRPAWSSHRPPLALLMRYLAAETGARVLLLGIQPADTGWGRAITPAVRDGIRRAVDMAERPPL